MGDAERDLDGAWRLAIVGASHLPRAIDRRQLGVAARLEEAVDLLDALRRQVPVLRGEGGGESSPWVLGIYI